MSEFKLDAEEIRITNYGEREDGWTFFVEVGRGDDLMEYYVNLDKSFWAKLTDRRIEPTELVNQTFRFLLERESKELILKKFNLEDVAKYFPDYKSVMKKVI